MFKHQNKNRGFKPFFELGMKTHCGSFTSVKFKVKSIDIEGGQNEIVLNEQEARCMDLNIMDRVKVKHNNREALAIVNYSHKYVRQGEAEVLAELAQTLGVQTGDYITLRPTNRPKSIDYIRKKLDKQLLKEHEIQAIIRDLIAERLSNAELAAFITAVYMHDLSIEEITALTRAIYETGDKLEFPSEQVIVSEHSIGGVAGDRTSMLLVPVLASLGVTIPKTCTRAISSASGTADTLEVLCPVSLSIPDIKKVVKKIGCCLVWGGAVNLAVADDKLIKIRNPLHLDPKSLLLASILAKKKAEGATHVLLDVPIGRGAKILELPTARALAEDFKTLGTKLGMKVDVVITDGSEPVSYAIGPALEAREVIKTLKGQKTDLLKEKTCIIAGMILKMVRGISKEEGYKIARHQIESGKAFEKFKELIEAQGGDPEINEKDIKIGEYTFDVKADADGKVALINNKSISRICRALGCPIVKSSGMVIHARVGKEVKEGESLFTLYSENKEKIKYAVEQEKQFPVVEIEKMVIETI